MMIIIFIVLIAVTMAELEITEPTVINRNACLNAEIMSEIWNI